MKVTWSRLAENDAEQILHYIADDNPVAAVDVYEQIYEKVSLLSTHPKIGKTGRVRGTRELVIVDTPYIVIYRITPNDIQVIRVVHGAQKWPPD
jgi:addiction module RelE/StbE family toxin